MNAPVTPLAEEMPVATSGFRTLFEKEVLRFWKVAFQTICAPVVNALLSLYLFRNEIDFAKVNPVFYLGIVLAVAGGGMVTKYKPNPAPKKPAAQAQAAAAAPAPGKPARRTQSLSSA